MQWERTSARIISPVGRWKNLVVGGLVAQAAAEERGGASEAMTERRGGRAALEQLRRGCAPLEGAQEGAGDRPLGEVGEDAHLVTASVKFWWGNLSWGAGIRLEK